MTSKEMADVIRERFLSKLSPAFAYVYKLEKKLNDISIILIDVCEEYGEEYCNDECGCDGGGDACLTRKILDVLEEHQSSEGNAE